MESGHDDESFPGERFSPMDDELLMFYLKPKVNGMQAPGEGDVIFEFDLYGDQDPWTIWKKFEARRANDLRRYKDLYFFTQKKKKTARGSRASRTVGRGGTWKGQNKGQDVYLLDDQTQKPTSTLLGSKKTYTYKNKGSVHDGCWILYEFELDESQIHYKKQANKNEYVLCSLRNNSKQNDVVLEKKRNRHEEDEILEDFVEVAIDPELVLEEPQEKRRCLLSCADYVPTSPSLEAEQQHLGVSDQEFLLQSEPFPSPSENDQAFLQIAMDDNVGLLTPPMLTEAELQQLNNEEFLQQGQMDMDENMRLLSPSFLDEAELKQLHNEGLLQPTPALEAEASSEVDVCGGNLVDAMVEEGWSMTLMETLMNDEQPNSMEVGEWNDTSLDFGYNLAF